MQDLVLHLKQQLETSKAPFLLAVSGGRDSMALLHLAHAAKLEIMVAHLDHALREDSSLDAEFVREVCTELEIPFFTERIPVSSIATKRGWSLEEAARNVRYEFLTRVAKKNLCQTILTAHTLEDNAETVLMQLLRGTARATGIPPRNARVYRPLLSVSKTQLEAYLLENNRTWREDPSNTDPSYTRNWVRLEILPRLTQRFPNATQRLARYATLARDEDAFLEQISNLPEWTDLRLEQTVIQRRYIRKILEQHKIPIDYQHLENLRIALEQPKTTRISLPNHFTGLVQNGKINIHPSTVEVGLLDHNDSTFGLLAHKTAPRGLFALGSLVPALTLPMPNANANTNVNANAVTGQPRGSPLRDLGGDSAFLLAQKAFPEAVLRSREAGDWIQLSGGTKKLSDLLIDKKVPRELRNGIPVLALGQRIVFVGFEPPLLDSSLPALKDVEFEAMRQALALAELAASRGEVPVGAVILQGETVVASAHNRSRELRDMTQHAELEVLRLASRVRQTPYLTDCTLVVTLEPCLMCLGAALEARVPRIVFAARNPKSGALGSVLDASRGYWNHGFTVRTGVLEKEAQLLLTTFFSSTRLT
jgi:tRNA(Ile)-lysidine synthase